MKASDSTAIRRVRTTGITIGSAGDATAVLATGDGDLHLDIYSGRVRGAGATGMRQFMRDLRVWHRYLGVVGDNRPFAKSITGWSNFIFAFIVLSGLYLWFPRQWTWRHVRPVVLFKGGPRGKARDFNWHNVIGMWSAVPLFIVVVSAVPISFRWANDAVYYAVGEQPPPARNAAAGREGGTGRSGGARLAAAHLDGLNGLWAPAERQVPGWRTINLRLPQSNSAPLAFAIDRGDGGQPHLRSTLTLDRESGDVVVSYEDFSTLPTARRIRNAMRFAHTGEVLGVPGQTAAGLVSSLPSAFVHGVVPMKNKSRRNPGKNGRRSHKRGTARRSCSTSTMPSAALLVRSRRVLLQCSSPRSITTCCVDGRRCNVVVEQAVKQVLAGFASDRQPPRGVGA